MFWLVFKYVTYSLDLAFPYFHTFIGLHNLLGGTWFHDEELLEEAVTNFRKEPSVVSCRYQQTHRSVEKMPR